MIALRFAIPKGARVAEGTGSMTLTRDDGETITFLLPPHSPFALVRGTLTNRTTKQTNTPTFRLPAATLDLGIPADEIRALGTTGLTKLDAHPGSYVFLTLADPATPATRAGLVAGWTTFESGDGALFSGRAGDTLTFAAQTDYDLPVGDIRVSIRSAHADRAQPGFLTRTP